MTSLHDQVISALDSQPEESGVIVCKSDGTVLADRDPAPGGAAVLVVIDAEPFRFPEPGPGSVRVGTWRVIEGGPAHRAVSRSERQG